jgi:hypothetical protein
MPPATRLVLQRRWFPELANPLSWSPHRLLQPVKLPARQARAAFHPEVAARAAFHPEVEARPDSAPPASPDWLARLEQREAQDFAQPVPAHLAEAAVVLVRDDSARMRRTRRK